MKKHMETQQKFALIVQVQDLMMLVILLHVDHVEEQEKYSLVKRLIQQ